MKRHQTHAEIAARYRAQALLNSVIFSKALEDELTSRKVETWKEKHERETWNLVRFIMRK